MSRAAVILRNIASNWGGFAVNAVITLLLTPFVLHQLGATRYGIWILTSSIIGYYGLLDLGFRAGVTQYLTRYLATRDYKKASECISSALAAFLSLAVLVALLSLAAAFFAPDWFKMPETFHHEAFWCILIVGLSSALQYAFFPFSVIFPATQRFDIANLIGVGTRLVTACGVYYALRAGYGLIGVSAATCGANTLDYLIRWRVSRWLVPHLDVSPRHARIARLREIFSFGAWNFLISINFYAYLHLPNILIAAFMRIAAVGHYSLVTGLLGQINSVLSPIGQVIYPAATDMHARGDRAGLERLYHDGSRFMLLIMISVVMIAGFYAEDFYRLWIGPQFLDGGPYHSVALLLRVLLLSVVTSYVSTVGGYILTGAGHVRANAVALLCGTFINFTVGIFLMQRYGLLGFAIGTVTASAVIDLCTIPVLVQRYLGFQVTSFARKVFPRPLVVAGSQAAILYFLHLGGRPDSWKALLTEGLLAGVLCASTVLVFGVTREERDRFLVLPVARFVRRFRTMSAPRP